MHSLPSIRVVCGEVLYLHRKTESTGIIFGEVERRIMNHPFTEIENQFMRILGPPFNDGKGIAWFSTTALGKYSFLLLCCNSMPTLFLLFS